MSPLEIVVNAPNPAKDFEITIEGKISTHGRALAECVDCPDRCRTCVLANRVLVNGVRTVWIQCATCKRSVRAVNASVVAEARAAGCVVGEWDDSYQRRRDEEGEAHRLAYETKTLADSAAWWARYNAHLRSDLWRNIRQRVLLRDRELCQGCLLAPAAHVHHTTYDHLGDELLFELVSLCVGCHEKTHDRTIGGRR